MDHVAHAHAALRNGASGQAVAILRAGAQAGDSESWTELGLWSLQARGMPRDLAGGRACFAKAAALGEPRARSILIALTANGIGGPADFPAACRMLAEAAPSDPLSRRQSALIAAMDLTDRGDPRALPAPRTLVEKPFVQLFPRLLGPEECAYLSAAAEPVFRPAHVGNAATGQQSYNMVRTCDTAGFPWIAEDPAIHAINRRLAAASGTRVECGEPLQVLRYRQGQEFRPHRDCTEATDNQRMFTMLVYLNADYDGGETHFLRCGLKLRGDVGDALLFRNADDSGRPDPDSLHAGLPVRAGEKRIASRWIRQKPFGPR